MLFYHAEFIILVTVVLLFLRFVPARRAQNIFLLAISYYFYAYWDWRYLGLILAITACNYLSGLALGRWREQRAQKLIVFAAMAIDLGILGFFKYYNFFVESLQHFVEPTGINTWSLKILLPVGISFYTFQSMSYTIDVYRKQLPVCRSLVDFSLFVAFFPQLVAGPIVRASELIPQIRNDREMTAARMRSGLRQFVLGLFKKVFIADNLAMFVDFHFSNAGLFDAPTMWLVVIAYALQIYCDFSGYSDMAIGVARMMGFDFSVNFNFPYIARTATDFWRRWHISLSSWLRDYLYIPLGGNRKGPARMQVNLLITMILGGLWHGASWNFVIWGLIHGMALIVHKNFTTLTRNMTVPTALRPLWQSGSWLLTMVVVLVCWVFFRASTFEQSWLILRQMFIPHEGLTHLSPFPLGVAAAFAIHHALLNTRFSRWIQLDLDQKWTPTILWLMLGITLLFWPEGFQPFIYFQF